MRRCLPLLLAVGATAAALLLTDCGGSSGGPLEVQVRARADGRLVSYQVAILDARGRRTALPRAAGGRRAPAPVIVVLDADGEEQHRERLSYG